MPRVLIDISYKVFLQTNQKLSSILCSGTKFGYLFLPTVVMQQIQQKKQKNKKVRILDTDDS